MLPPQAEGKEGPGEVAGCGARLEALDLNHANWQSMASQLSQNGSSKTTSSCLQADPVKLTREEPRSERCEQSLHLGGARMSKRCGRSFCGISFAATSMRLMARGMRAGLW